MLNFIQTPQYHQACKQLAASVADYHRSQHKNQGASPAFMGTGFIPHPDTVANELADSLRTMNLRRLNLPLLEQALRNNLRGDRWLYQIHKLFSVLIEMERLAAGELDSFP